MDWTVIVLIIGQSVNQDETLLTFNSHLEDIFS